MIWYVCGIASAAILVISWIWAFILSQFRGRGKGTFSINTIIFSFAAVAGIVFFLPKCLGAFEEPLTLLNTFNGVLSAALEVMLLFTLGGSYIDGIMGMEFASENLEILYYTLGAVLYTYLPILTFGFILSFFKNLSAHRRYALSFWKRTHVFSKLNEKTMALAKSILEDELSKKKRFMAPQFIIVFTDVVDTESEEMLDLIDDANELGAIMFSEDLESIKYRRKHSMRKLRFYLISDDEEEKIRHAKNIISNYDYTDVELKIFSNDIRSELLLNMTNANEIKIARVNDIQALVYHHLDEHGLRLFKGAREAENGEKVISAVIVGLGKYGKEVLKTLAWFCQISGYYLKINAYDSDPNAEKRMKDLCPALLDEEYNGKRLPGYSQYDIKIHSGTDVFAIDFTESFSSITDATYVFICLGNDDVNLNASTKIKMLTERIHYTGDGHKPDIEAIVYDSTLKRDVGETWEGDTDGEPKRGIGVHLIGDLDDFYAVDTVINSELINDGLKVHRRYMVDGCKSDKELAEIDKSFWQKEYNYRSSISKALHERLRRRLKLDVPGVNTAWEDLSEDEKLEIGKIEHPRWDAYMRTEGFVYSGSRDKATKSVPAKLHHNMVSVNDLTDDDLRKDA